MSEIDRIRQSAGRMRIGDGETGVITGHYGSSEQLLVVRNDSVYRVQMADQIDPDRTNPDIPNVNQRLFDIGADSEIIRRSLLTAGELFRAPEQAEGIDIDRARAISLDVTIHIVAAFGAADSLHVDVEAALVRPVTVRERSAQLPAVGGLWPRFAALLQSVEHAFQEMYQLALLFVPEARANGRFFEGFRDAVGQKVGEDTNFFRFAAELADRAAFVRNVRECIEHERTEQRLVIKDFEMTPSGTFERPTIEVIHPRTPLDKADLAILSMDLAKLALDGFESLCAHLAASNIDPSLPLPVWIDVAPEGQRRPDRSDICYLVNLGGEIARLG